MRKFKPHDPPLFYSALCLSLWSLGMGVLGVIVARTHTLTGIIFLDIFCATPGLIALVLWGYVLEARRRR